MAIPLPGAPGQAFLSGINTGSNMFGQMMQPIISREQMMNQKMLQEQRLAQALQQHKDNLAMQQMVQQGLQSRHQDNLAVKQGNLKLKQDMAPFEQKAAEELAKYRTAQAAFNQEKLNFAKQKFPLEFQRLQNQTKDAQAKYQLNQQKLIEAQRNNDPRAVAEYQNNMMLAAQEVAQSEAQMDALGDQGTQGQAPAAQTAPAQPSPFLMGTDSATSTQGLSNVLGASPGQAPTVPTVPTVSAPTVRPWNQMTQTERQKASSIYEAASGKKLPTQTPEEKRLDKVRLKQEQDWSKERQDIEKELNENEGVMAETEALTPVLDYLTGEPKIDPVTGRKDPALFGPKDWFNWMPDKVVENYRLKNITDEKMLEGWGKLQTALGPILAAATQELGGSKRTVAALNQAIALKINPFDPPAVARSKLKAIIAQLKHQRASRERRHMELVRNLNPGVNIENIRRAKGKTYYQIDGRWFDNEKGT